MRQKKRRSPLSNITAPSAGQLHRRPGGPAPVLTPLKPHLNGEAFPPMGRVGRCDCRGRDEVKVF